LKQILIVDDSAVIRRVARRIFETFHFRTAEAESGAEALAECQKAMPDVILVDWRMPKMDGLEFVGALRRLPGGDSPKVLYCAVEGDAGHVARAKRAGADDYIMKPFDAEILRRKFIQNGLL
jgi:two-component system chemotaxis response regulator CheY